MIRVHPLARLVELRLLIWVAAFSLAGYVAVVAAASGRFAWYEIAVPVAVLAVFGALHVFLVSVGFRGDQLLLPIAVGLTGIGFVLVERLAPTLLLQQLSWLVIAAGAFCVTILVPRDLSVLARFKYTWALIGVILLVSPLLPGVGREINGARIWVGVTGVAQFEPWELVKLALVIFFAAYLEEYREVLSTSPRRIGPIPLPPIPYLLPIVAMWVVAMLVMVFEKDLGATLLFFGIFLAMLYLATGELAYVLVGLVMLAAGGFVAYHAFGHVAARVDVWLAPFDSDLRFDTAFQLTQGLFSLANAGLLGAGLGNGMPERIPVVWSDFVFDAFTEEVGFVGALALLAFYLVFVYRGMLIALRAPTAFLQLVAAGLSFIVAFQTLVIVGGNAKLIPLTGITLPFVAYGGSSLVTNFVLVALLLRVSDITARVRR
ncbi:MAG TPA: FtsW/RodA/SpoVE family cell cycle protein [Candidatus Limnocylindria bacterium]|nr:FtsW/RodA/SpoVE family cell cycle protein [Candidatus Limnocylindria bacterium]